MDPERLAQAEFAVRAWNSSATIEAAQVLGGGMSAHMLALDLETPGEGSFRVVARFPNPYLRTLFDDPATQEFRTLEALRASGLPVPRPLALGDAPDGRFLLLEYLPGKATAAPDQPERFLDQMAKALASIHAVDLNRWDFGFLMATRQGFTPPDRVPNDDLRESEVIAALRGCVPSEPGPYVLRHGDFWPGNLLWSDGELTGIIDWENALRGPAIADLGISRLDVRWILGAAAVEDFTARYLALNPLDLRDLAYWDLRAALRPMGDLSLWADPYAALERPDITYDHLRQVLLDFVDDAFSRAGAPKKG